MSLWRKRKHWAGQVEAVREAEAARRAVQARWPEVRRAVRAQQRHRAVNHFGERIAQALGEGRRR